MRDGTRPVAIGDASPGETRQIRRGRSVLHAEIVDRFDAWALRDECRDLVVDVLAHAGIPQRTLPSLDDQPHRVVVSSTDTERVRVALRALGADRRLHIARLAPSGRGPVAAMSSTPELRAGDVLRVFAPQVSLAGRLLPTRELGVDLEVWDEISSARPSPDGPLLPVGTLVAPRPNPYARTIPPGALEQPAADPPSPTLEQVAFPIDVVYTWVDSDDPGWQRDFAEARGLPGSAAGHESSWSPSRFTSRDELRYSLRSVAAYASWVRTIFVVTNGQVPSWLDTDHPQVRVVRHDEIFADPSHLPTFSSHAIEANLHRIPGLAQHYLYLNDDVFLARPLRPEYFFTASGLLRYFPSMVPVDEGEVSADELPVVQAFKNARTLMEERFGRRPATRPRHTPHPQRRDVLEDIDAACPDLVTRTSAARFRSPTDLSFASQLQAWWADETGRAVPSGTTYEFIDLADPAADARIERMLVRADLDCFCLNETTQVDEGLAASRVERILTTLLPFPSPYEVTE
ncbi:stealth conserved region 3 domain-containing protein [Janibacter sp. YIM B02568]|uniref:stealth conserved region 3 domain-containing protein n=1 Tax=Janibacter endophyticus TaxID=2806261 RepID=UPI00194FF97C|nr:stealth conserved region 3 domain-containing protein [Janibacter endophyticus]MBM6545228.1 stealth conserved region 3 domain-containing protein [Janibacter endophyticus]